MKVNLPQSWIPFLLVLGALLIGAESFVNDVPGMPIWAGKLVHAAILSLSMLGLISRDSSGAPQLSASQSSSAIKAALLLVLCALPLSAHASPDRQSVFDWLSNKPQETKQTWGLTAEPVQRKDGAVAGTGTPVLVPLPATLPAAPFSVGYCIGADYEGHSTFRQLNALCGSAKLFDAWGHGINLLVLANPDALGTGVGVELSSSQDWEYGFNAHIQWPGIGGLPFVGISFSLTPLLR